MIPSRWAGRVILSIILVIMLVFLSISLPIFAVRYVDDSGNSHDSAVVYRDYIDKDIGLNDLFRDSVLSTAMWYFTVTTWIWMLLAIMFIGLMLLNIRWGSLVWGWIMAITGAISIAYLSAKLAATSGSLAYANIEGFYGTLTSSGGTEYHWGPGLGWWVLLIAVIIQILAVMARTYSVIHESKTERAWTETPPAQDGPKPT
ncbi:MAG: hypothetical protein ABIE25_08820 [Thermoplasmatota archaeon]|nr:hypothetical protein [Candidatus Thermoplasmatota archaeon]MBU1913640.1 hypothetical protein [Candidatus Thermoplasmatota archaeon]